jgi:Na+/H+ antiporter NhaC
LVIVLLLAVTTNMVELSLYSAILVGGCMVTGNLIDGFKSSLDTYLLNAVADVGHVYVILFTLFLSGMVGMMQRSGGMNGFTKDVAKIATTPRLGQAACFTVGCFIFFDDYANVLLAGETMRPLLDVLFISREKLAFIVDATAAPVASISPISSWVGFEVGLIQEQVDRIVALEGTSDLSIKTSGFGIFLQSIKYRYYPIFMIFFIIFLIYSGRDFGPMLVAERKTRVYKRNDGGDGRGKTTDLEGKGENNPREDTPEAAWNLVMPVFLLIFFIFYLLVKTGEIEGEDQNLMDKIEASDSYSALLWGTMAAAICSVFFYLLQIVQDGEFVFLQDGKPVIPNLDVFKRLLPFRKANEEDPKPRSVMSVLDSTESFLFGMGRIFPALIVLTLAWASGGIMVAVGADRLFSRWIVGGISPEALPTLAFLISLFMALATGTSKQSLLFGWLETYGTVVLLSERLLASLSHTHAVNLVPSQHMFHFHRHELGHNVDSLPIDLGTYLASLGRGRYHLLRHHSWSPEWECGWRSHQSHFRHNRAECACVRLPAFESRLNAGTLCFSDNRG